MPPQHSSVESWLWAVVPQDEVGLGGNGGGNVMHQYAVGEGSTKVNCMNKISVHRLGVVEGIPVKDVVLDNGCFWTMVHHDLVQGHNRCRGSHYNKMCT